VYKRYTWYQVYRLYVIELPRLSIRDARSGLADVVDKAARDQPTVLTRRGIPVAAVVSIDILRRYLELEEREINLIIDERRSEGSEAAVPLDDVLRETLSRDE
jgi:prevent-host-death family protein